MENLTIDIVIPIYFEGLNIRYLHTKKIFKYMNNLAKELINDKIILSFTVIGCDTELSKNLFTDIFIHNDVAAAVAVVNNTVANAVAAAGDVNAAAVAVVNNAVAIAVVNNTVANAVAAADDVNAAAVAVVNNTVAIAVAGVAAGASDTVVGVDNTYIIFNQGNYIIPSQYYSNGGFQKMLNNKIELGITHSIKKNKDITMIMGSNDLICKEFYKQIRDKFNENEKQFYGINRTNKNNKNSVIFFDLKQNQLKLNDKSILGCWNGQYPQQCGLDVQYAGGTVGFNRRIYKNLIKRYHDWSREDMLENWCKGVLKCKFILCKCIYYLNIKTDSDITSKKANSVVYTNITTIDKIKTINEPIYNSLIDTIKYYNNLPDN